MIFGIVYVLVFLVTWPVIALASFQHLIRNGYYEGFEDKLMAALMGLVGASLWPITFPLLWVARRLPDPPEEPTRSVLDGPPAKRRGRW